MDLRKFSTFVIIAGLVVALFGIVKYVEISGRLDNTMKSIGRNYSPFDRFDRSAARASAKNLQEGPILIMGLGAVIVIIGIGINHSAKKSLATSHIEATGMHQHVDKKGEASPVSPQLEPEGSGIICANCGVKTPADSRFCISCGKALGEASKYCRP